MSDLAQDEEWEEQQERFEKMEKRMAEMEQELNKIHEDLEKRKILIHIPLTEIRLPKREREKV